ncbi:MAG: Stp1/IreP family PP2C-type Ser/Thr phosphatase [Clostridia bacterium]|nr:Stp1/IreP family PP2C-type Ser/Thr phosphatase [Clostridia bacterium]
MQICSGMDKGKVRATNQDAFKTEMLDGNTCLAVVCDGMGGANAGNVASSTAVKSIVRYVSNSYRKDFDGFKISDLLKNAVISANIELYGMSVSNPSYKGMGTTVVAAIIKDNVAYICNVGDSRAYLVNGELTQITKDHSVVQSLIESGKLTAEQARVHPDKNVITKALGVDENILPDNFVQELCLGDTILICTDGLTNYVEPEDILKILKKNEVKKVADTLIDTANSNGGGDNITVVTVTV